MTEPTLALQLSGIRKQFPSEGASVVALDDARLLVRAGEIHALLGENGAGKSTLVSIAAGHLRPDAGMLRRRGQPMSFDSPVEAMKAGVALVPQHDLLVEAASVADNLARLDPSAGLFESRRQRRERARRLAAELELDLGDPDARVAELPVGTRQRIEVAGSLQSDPDVLILDEPTSVLSPDETRALFAALRHRADAGKAVVLITHRISETFAAADRVTVLANGRTVLEKPIREVTPEALAERLVTVRDGERGAIGPVSPGREEGPSAAGAAPEALSPGPSGLTIAEKPALDVSSLSPSGWRGEGVSLRLLPGELRTLLAIDGNGADVLGSALAGVHGARGRIAIAGRSVPCGNPVAFRRAGGAFVPRDRRREGIFPSLTLAENLALSSPGGFWLDRGRMRDDARVLLSRFGVKAASERARARELSGGNQQKLVLARELARNPRALVAIHPTRGLDVGAAAELRARLVESARAGCGVLVVTADPEEAQELGGPIRVVYRDRLGDELPARTPLEALLRRMGGLP